MNHSVVSSTRSRSTSKSLTLEEGIACNSELASVASEKSDARTDMQHNIHNMHSTQDVEKVEQGSR